MLIIAIECNRCNVVLGHLLSHFKVKFFLLSIRPKNLCRRLTPPRKICLDSHTVLAVEMLLYMLYLSCMQRIDHMMKVFYV